MDTNDAVANAMHITERAIRAHKIVDQLISAKAPNELLDGAIKFAAETRSEMLDALDAVPNCGPGRGLRLGDFVAIALRHRKISEKNYSTLHWCIMEYADAVVSGDKWDGPGEDPEKPIEHPPEGEEWLFDLIVQEVPPTQNQIDDYKVRCKFADYLDWLRYGSLP